MNTQIQKYTETQTYAQMLHTHTHTHTIIHRQADTQTHRDTQMHTFPDAHFLQNQLREVKKFAQGHAAS